MSRGTFANIRLVNKLNEGGKSGPKTLHIPSNEVMDVFDAAEKYIEVSYDFFICLSMIFYDVHYMSEKSMSIVKQLQIATNSLRFVDLISKLFLIPLTSILT